MKRLRHRDHCLRGLLQFLMQLCGHLLLGLLDHLCWLGRVGIVALFYQIKPSLICEQALLSLTPWQQQQALAMVLVENRYCRNPAQGVVPGRGVEGEDGFQVIKTPLACLLKCCAAGIIQLDLLSQCISDSLRNTMRDFLQGLRACCDLVRGHALEARSGGAYEEDEHCCQEHQLLYSSCRSHDLRRMADGCVVDGCGGSIVEGCMVASYIGCEF